MDRLTAKIETIAEWMYSPIINRNSLLDFLWYTYVCIILLPFLPISLAIRIYAEIKDIRKM